MRSKVFAISGLSTIVAGILVVGLRSQNGTKPEWIPVVAKQDTKIFRLTAQGKELIQESTGIRLQNSDGSTYVRVIPVGGIEPEQMGHATLVNLRAGKVYSISYAQKLVSVTREAPPGQPLPTLPVTPEEFRSRYTPHAQLGKRVIEGIECEGYRVSPRPGGNLSGEIWAAPAANFLIVESTIIDSEANVEIVTKLHDIQIGKEPDPRFFQLPEGFSVAE
jgi:hypothetical protein